MPKLWHQVKHQFTWLINSRLVVVNVLVLFVAILLLLLVLSVAKVKPPQQVVSITPINDTTDSVSLTTTTPGLVSKQTSLPSDEAASVVIVDKPWSDETPQWPVAGKVMLAYGWQIHPVFNDWRYHRGLDIATAPGERVIAALSGIVVSSGEARHTGLTVVIASGGRQISYGCLSRTLLKANQKVFQGEVIGFTGQSPGEPYPHLHIGLKVDDDDQDPQKIFY
jgi:murein DD-endopeptidase MepM/ murein hydrolase activator NlpD